MDELTGITLAMSIGLGSGLYIAHVFIPPTPGPIAAANTLGIGDNLLLVMGLGAKMFVIAGPVIVYGTLSSVLYGLILCTVKLFTG